MRGIGYGRGPFDKDSSNYFREKLAQSSGRSSGAKVRGRWSTSGLGIGTVHWINREMAAAKQHRV
jgi:hypothetical protein